MNLCLSVFRFRRLGGLSVTGLVLTALLAACGGDGDRLVVGSKNFTEQVVLGELLAQHIEAHTDLTVERKLNLGGTFICHEGVRSGELDLYVEYTGTAFTALLQRDPIADPDSVYAFVQDAYRDRFDLVWTEPLGFNNTYAIVVRQEDAERLGLTTVSDVAPHAPGWQGGFGYEFVERKDGYDGLVATYGLDFGAPPRTMELGLMYRALRNGQVDLIAGNSTDGLIQRLNLVVLEDDRGYFPPYEAAPVVRAATLEAHPELRPLLADLGGVLTEAEMRRLNDRVVSGQEAVPAVVAAFLREKGLVPD